MRACAALLVGLLARATAAQAPEASPSPTPPERALARALLGLATPADQDAWLDEHRGQVSRDFVRQLIAAGHTEADAGRLDRGDRAVQLVGALASRDGLVVEAARAACLSARLALQRGDYDGAKAEFLACKQQLEGAGPDANAWLAEPARSLNVLELERGRFEQAVVWGRQAVAADERGGTERNVGRSLLNLGMAYSASGDFARAMEAFGRALEIAQRLKNATLVGALLSELAQIHYYQGRPEIALDYFQRTLDIAAREGTRRDHAIALMNMSVALKDQKRYDEALALLAQARTLAEQTGMRAELAKALKQVGSTHYARGDYAEALQALDETLGLAEELGAEPILINALTERARVLLRLGRPLEAQAAAERAAALAEAAASLQQLRTAQGAIGEAREARGDQDGALRAWRAAIDATERIRERVAGGEEERQGFFGMHIEPYREALRLELRQGHTAEAFRIAETAHARSLLDVLKVGRVRPTTLSPQEREEERRVEERLARAEKRTSPAAAPGMLGGPASPPGAELQEARTALTDLRARVYAAHPELRLLRGEIEPLTPDAASAQLLDPETALLLYSVAPRHSHLMVLTRTPHGPEPQLAAYTIEISAEALSRRVIQFRERIQARDLDLSSEATGLYELLLGPAREVLAGHARLVIVPDGVLWELPFQALQPRIGRYLLQDATLSYAPSLTALAALQERPHRRAATRPELLAFGDPLYAPAAGLRTLPQTGRLARNLARVFGPQRSRVYVGRDASESQFKAQAGSARLLHVAAHGVLDGASPMFSYLALASEPSGAPEDGHLEARELLGLDLDADLVSLSACETARGRISEGEGIIGLAWATLLAGARSVVVSQWRVEADASERILLGLYRRIAAQQRQGANLDVAGALHDAALALLADPGTRHPFYWAGFIQVGASRPRPAPSG